MIYPCVMGIINVTPDSFSGDGLLRDEAYALRALRQAEEMLKGGASILDVGGESSRPGAIPISAKEEIERAVPAIHAIKAKFPEAVISIDTVKADVAEQACDAGASIINDITGLEGDPEMGKVAAKFNARVVLMHNRSKAQKVRFDPRNGGQYEAPSYGDVVEDVRRDLTALAENAFKAGIKKDNIILDPGIGFGKTPEQNLALIAHLKRFKELGFPLLVGLSRKAFIGHVLDAPVEDRLEGTAAGVAVSVFNGADIVRVHDVKVMALVVKMAAALRNAAGTAKEYIDK